MYSWILKTKKNTMQLATRIYSSIFGTEWVKLVTCQLIDSRTILNRIAKWKSAKTKPVKEPSAKEKERERKRAHCKESERKRQKQEKSKEKVRLINGRIDVMQNEGERREVKAKNERNRA